MKNNQDIRHLRECLGETQKEFARRLGITEQYVSLLETGRRQPSRHLVKHMEMLRSQKRRLA
ncbi:MAG: helix-turn-helix transcriptional regulator [Acidobacteriota bacterium]